MGDVLYILTFISFMFFGICTSLLGLEYYMYSHNIKTTCIVDRHEYQIKVCGMSYPWEGYVVFCRNELKNNISRSICYTMQLGCNFTKKLLENDLRTRYPLSSGINCWYWYKEPWELTLKDREIDILEGIWFSAISTIIFIILGIVSTVYYCKTYNSDFRDTPFNYLQSNIKKCCFRCCYKKKVINIESQELITNEDL